MFKILEHTSDLFIEVEGASYEEAIEDLVNGLFKFMGNCKGKEKILIKYKNKNKELELVGFINKIIEEIESRKFCPNFAKIKYKKGIIAEIYGEKKEPKNIIKAATFHELEIKKTKKGYKIKILLDV